MPQLYQKSRIFVAIEKIKHINRDEKSSIVPDASSAGHRLSIAQNKAEIKFDKTTHDFGTFSEDSAVVSCTFTFTNVGKGPLVIHQAIASWMHSAQIYPGAVLPARPHRHGDLQWHRTLSGAFPQVHHPAHQCRDRDAPPLHRRRHGS